MTTTSVVRQMRGVAEAGDHWRGKARTLLDLASRVRTCVIPDSMCVSYADWRNARSSALSRIVARFGDRVLAVRSDARFEDAEGQSFAGCFHTALNVASNDIESLIRSIDAVFTSYGEVVSFDNVLLQPMVEGTRASYVASTHTVDELAPYYTLSYAIGPDSTAVTSGRHGVQTVYFARNEVFESLPDDFQSVLAILRELEDFFPHRSLEAEIVLTSSEAVLLQVRPIATQAVPLDERLPLRALRAAIKRSAIAREERERGILGTHRIYGQMPDWNLAELLGSHPRPLAHSIFSKLIARRSWRIARARLGYRPLRARNLLMNIAGRPFVDVRLSFNSFLPSGLDDGCGERLVNGWTERLRGNPYLHDRVEFDVVGTCVDFDWEERQRHIYSGLLSSTEWNDYRTKLLRVTRQTLSRNTLTQVSDLLSRVEFDDQNGDGDIFLTLAKQIRDAESKAALPFAVAARQAFAFEAVLRSAVRCGELRAERLEALRRSIATVSGEFLGDWLCSNTDEAQAAMLCRYGHLRPGTFEISVPTYAENSEDWRALSLPAGVTTKSVFRLTHAERVVLQRLCDAATLGLDANELIDGYRESIRAREFGKFVFSRGVSAILQTITEWGASRGLDRETLAWIELDELVNAVGDGDRSISTLRDFADEAQHRHETERRIKLPLLLDGDDDLRIVRCDVGAPSFQGRGVVAARLVVVDAHTRPSNVPLHSIVAIENADPGFDWIFTRAPRALITAYGGPNSHMAIRCAENACGAVLGLGVESYRRRIRASRATIDFDAGTIESLSA